MPSREVFYDIDTLPYDDIADKLPHDEAEYEHQKWISAQMIGPSLSHDVSTASVVSTMLGMSEQMQRDSSGERNPLG